MVAGKASHSTAERLSATANDAMCRALPLPTSAITATSRAILPVAAQSLKVGTQRRRLTLASRSASHYPLSVKFGVWSLEKPLTPQRKDFRPRRLMQCVGHYLYLRRPLQRYLAHYFRPRRERWKSRLAINAMYRPNSDVTRSLEKPLSPHRKDFRPRRFMRSVGRYLCLCRPLERHLAQYFRLRRNRSKSALRDAVWRCSHVQRHIIHLTSNSAYDRWKSLSLHSGKTFGHADWWNM